MLVLQNAPTSESYAVGSFVERLFNGGSFDAAGCQALEAALLALIFLRDVLVNTATAILERVIAEVLADLPFHTRAR
jgi:hypothetical protein